MYPRDRPFKSLLTLALKACSLDEQAFRVKSSRPQRTKNVSWLPQGFASCGWDHGRVRIGPEEGDMGRRWVSVLVTTGLLTALLSAGAGATPDPHGVLERAMALRAAYHLKQSIEVIEAAYGQHPTDPQISLVLAGYYNAIKAHARSLALYQSVLAARPGDATALVGVADELAWMKRTPDAIALCREVLGRRDAPREALAKARVVLIGAEASEAYGHGLVSLIHYAFGVLPALKEAASTDPQSPEVHFALGRYYLHAPAFLGGDARKAASELDLARRLDPYDFTIRAWWISALKHAGANVAPMLASYRTDYQDLAPARLELEKALALKAP